MQCGMECVCVGGGGGQGKGGGGLGIFCVWGAVKVVEGIDAVGPTAGLSQSSAGARRTQQQCRRVHERLRGAGGVVQQHNSR
jgi:hypothetical protein